MEIVKARVMNRIDSEANWLANDPVILNGEITLTKRGNLIAIRVGDGIKKYSELTDNVVVNADGAFKGGASPSSSPGALSGPAYWVTSEAGTYENFGGLVVNPSSLAVISWNGSEFTVTQTEIDMDDYLKNNELNDALVAAGLPTFDFGKNTPEIGVNTTAYTFIFETEIISDAALIKVDVAVLLSGYIKIKRFRKSNDGLSYNFINEVQLDVEAGLNSIDVERMQFEKGDVIAVQTDAGLNYVVEPSFSPYLSKLEDITSDVLISSLDPSSPTLNLQIFFKFFEKSTKQDVVDYLVNGALKEFKFGESEVSVQGPSNNAYTFIFKKDVPNGSLLKSMQIASSASGTLLVKKINQTGNTYTFIEEVEVDIVVGVNDIQFENPIRLNSGDRIGIFSTTNGIITNDNDNQFVNPFVYVAGNFLGTTSTVDESTTQDMQINFTIVSLNDVEDGYLTGNQVLNYDFVDEIPSNIEQTGTPWTKHFGKAVTSNTGLSNSLQSRISLNLDSKVIRSVFSIDTANGAFGMFARPTTYSESGSIVSVDLSNNKMTVYDNWNGSNTLPTAFTDKVVSFTLLQNRLYMLEMISYFKNVTFKITDLVSGQSDLIVRDGGDEVKDDGVGYCYGVAGVFSITGTVSVKLLQHIVDGTKYPKVILYGDSITEGYEINIQDCYSYKVVKLLEDQAYTSAQSSCLPIHVLRRLDQELKVFSPKYIFVLIGTNSTDMTEWSNGIDEIAERIKSNGSVPIFGCIPPNQQNPSQVNTWNDVLLSKGYRCVRFDLAMTINNDRSTINPAMFQPDLRHPNGVGGTAMANRFKIDVPELFDY